MPCLASATWIDLFGDAAGRPAKRVFWAKWYNLWFCNSKSHLLNLSCNQRKPLLWQIYCSPKSTFLHRVDDSYYAACSNCRTFQRFFQDVKGHTHFGNLNFDQHLGDIHHKMHSAPHPVIYPLAWEHSCFLRPPHPHHAAVSPQMDFCVFGHCLQDKVLENPFQLVQNVETLGADVPHQF